MASNSKFEILSCYMDFELFEHKAHQMIPAIKEKVFGGLDHRFGHFDDWYDKQILTGLFYLIENHNAFFGPNDDQGLIFFLNAPQVLKYAMWKCGQDSCENCG